MTKGRGDGHVSECLIDGRRGVRHLVTVSEAGFSTASYHLVHLLLKLGLYLWVVKKDVE